MEQELERLDDLGIWVITRFDEDYPPRFSERLKGAAPGCYTAQATRGC